MLIALCKGGNSYKKSFIRFVWLCDGGHRLAETFFRMYIMSM